MALYSKNNQYPTVLPERITFPDGSTRTDSASFTVEEISLAGYIEVPNPPDCAFPNRLEWSGDSWLIRPPSIAEIELGWSGVRKIRDQLLSESDILVLKAYERKTEVPDSIVLYRQALRDITKQSSPWEVIWPQKPTEE